MVCSIVPLPLGFSLTSVEDWKQPARAMDAATHTNPATDRHTRITPSLGSSLDRVAEFEITRARTTIWPRSPSDVATVELRLATHPEFRRDPKVRATADFLKRMASGTDGLR